jgi:NTE family protein
MNRPPIVMLLISLLLATVPVRNCPAQDSASPIPRIGLALSGGGAKGLAHIGVLKVLKEAGIKVEYISGTSMGSIVGALYSIGYDPETIERIVLEQEWQALLSDKIRRRHLSMEEKQEDNRYMFSFPIHKRSIGLPTGLTSGQKASLLLTRLCLPVHHVEQFETLPIPFRCVATDLETGDAVVLDHGFLPDVLRASMSLPSIFSPVEIDGRLLVDGYLARNLPASDVSEMGADIVIGVDVGAPLYKKDELNSLFKVLDQAVNFRGAAENKRQQNLCDLLIKPDLEDFGPMSFDQAAAMIARGEQAARAMLPQLRQLADTLGSKKPNRRSLSQINQLGLTELRFEGLKNVSSKLLEAKLNLKIPSRITIAELEQAVDRVWGSKFFERVNYRIEPGLGGTALVIRVVEQNDDFFNLSVHYDSDLKSSVLLNFTYRNLWLEGSKLTLEGSLSENETYTANYTIFTNWKPGIAVGLQNAFNNFTVNIYDDDGQLVAKVDYYLNTSQLHLMTIFSNEFALGTMLQVRHSSSKKIIAPEGWTFGSYTLTSLVAFADLDTWDRTIYPTRGVKMTAMARFTTDWLADADPGWFTEESPPDWFGIYSLSVDGAVAMGKKMSLLYSLHGGMATDNTIPEDYKLALGGHYLFLENSFPFLGLNFLELFGTHVYTIHTGLQYNFGGGKVAQLRANIGKATSNSNLLFQSDGMLAGAGLTLGWHTPLGPLEYTLSYGSRHHEFFNSLTIGYRF